MEEPKLSEKNLLVSIYNGIFAIEERCQLIENRIEDLEEKLQKIFWFIEFHLGEVPLKHRKLFPEKGEYPY
jgi:hypothetical protein